MNFWAILAAATAGAFLLGCAVGYSNRDTAARASAAKAYKAAIEQQTKLQGQLNAVSAQYEAQRDKANAALGQRTQTIREFYRQAPPVDANCALPNPMYSLLANAVRDANIASAPEPGSELPAASGATDPRR